jgi:hypothetical protein
MADVNKTIGINFEATTDDLQDELKKIPKVTERAAKGMLREFDAGMKKTELRAKVTAKSIAKSFKAAGKVAGALGKVAGALAIGTLAAGAGIVAFGQHIADLNNQLSDAATRSGLATDTLAGLRLAAEGSGLAFENLQRGLDKLPSVIQDVRTGSKQATEALAKIGISADEVANSNSDQIFKKIAFQIGSIKDPAEKSAAAIDIFGQQAGAALIQTGALDNLSSYVNLAREFGVSVGPQAAKEAARFQRAIAELGTVSQGVASNMLLLITDSTELSDVLFLASDSVVYFGSILETTITAARGVVGLLATDFAISAAEVVQYADIAKTALSGNVTAAIRLREHYATLNAELRKKAAAEAADGLRALGSAADTAQVKVEQLQKSRAAILEAPAGTTPDDTRQAASDLHVQKEALQLASARARVQQIFLDTFKGQLSGEGEIIQKYSDQIQELVDLKKAHGEVLDISMARSELEFAREQELAEFRQQANADWVESTQAAAAEIVAESDRIKSAQMDLLQEIATSAVSITNSISTVVQNAGEKTTQITRDMSKGEREAARQRNQEIKERSTRLFMATKAAGIAEVAINTAIGISKIQALYAAAPPIAGALTALTVATGAAQIAAIQSQPVPQFDVGGMVGRSSGPDVTTANLLSGEAVLDRATVRSIGGEQGVRELQRGGPQGPAVVVVQPFKHFDKFMTASSRRGRYTRSSTRPIGIGSY